VSIDVRSTTADPPAHEVRPTFRFAVLSIGGRGIPPFPWAVNLTRHGLTTALEATFVDSPIDYGAASRRTPLNIDIPEVLRTPVDRSLL
jgi:hypothetical protein